MSNLDKKQQQNGSLLSLFITNVSINVVVFFQDKEVYGSVKMITFLRRHSTHLDRAQPDGNCLFRSLSKQLFHSEKHHSTLQKTLTEHAASYPEVYSSWTIEGLSLQEHILKMKEPGTWGSQLEIAAPATLFKKTIYVASDSLVPNECQWTAFPPLTCTVRPA